MHFDKYNKYWHDLQAIVRVESKRIIGNKEEIATRYYITSLPFSEYKRACQAIRQHWAVENNLHWKLDFGLAEDVCQVTRDFADQNLSSMMKNRIKPIEEWNQFKERIRHKKNAGGTLYPIFKKSDPFLNFD